MGHTEMKLAVAGLNDNAIANLRRQLGGKDWSMFRPAEQAAFRFARKQALDPDAVTAGDYQNLVEQFGSEQAIDGVDSFEQARWRRRFGQLREVGRDLLRCRGDARFRFGECRAGQIVRSQAHSETLGAIDARAREREIAPHAAAQSRQIPTPADIGK